MEERDRRSGSGGRAVDGLWTGWRRLEMEERDRRSVHGSCRNSMGGG